MTNLPIANHNLTTVGIFGGNEKSPQVVLPEGTLPAIHLILLFYHIATRIAQKP